MYRYSSINEFLTSVVYKKDVPLLYEIAGSCMSRSNELNKAFVLIGGPKSGKSSYLKLIRLLLGDINISNFSIQRLVKDKYCIAELDGKIANIYEDSDTDPISSDLGISKLNSIIEGELLYGDRKGLSPIEVKSSVTLLFSCQTRPEWFDSYMSHPINSRFVLIKFAGTFSDNHILDNIYSDKELGLFSKTSKDYYAKAVDRGQFTRSNYFYKHNVTDKIMEESPEKLLERYEYIKRGI